MVVSASPASVQTTGNDAAVIAYSASDWTSLMVAAGQICTIGVTPDLLEGARARSWLCQTKQGAV